MLRAPGRIMLALLLSGPMCRAALAAAEEGACPEQQALRGLSVPRSPDQDRPESHSRLMQAVLADQPDLVRTLLVRGDDPNLADTHGRTPLMASVLTGDVQIERLLLLKGAAVNARDGNGWTAAMMAAWNDNRPGIGYLLGRGADLQLRGNRGESAWSLAGQRRFTELQSWLVSRGAKADSPGTAAPDASDALSEPGAPGLVPDSRPAPTELLRSAGQGCAWARYSLAACYRRGEDLPQDAGAAEIQERAAAQAGYAPCALDLAGEHFDGGGADDAQEVAWCRSAAEAGYPDGQFMYGYLLLHGYGCAADPLQGKAWLRKSTAGGDLFGAYELAHAESSGTLLKGHAMEDFLGEARASSDADCLYQAGEACLSGGYLPKDLAKARFLFERAAALNHVDAMAEAADLEEHGDGGPQDPATARRWYGRLLGPKGSFRWDKTPAPIMRINWDPALDGTFAPFAQARSLRLDCGDPSKVIYQPCGAPNELAADIRMMVNGRCLYLGAKVELGRAPRNQHSGDRLWDGDCVEFWICSAPDLTDRSHPQRTKWDHVVFMAPTSADGKPQLKMGGLNVRAVAGARFLSTSNGTGYVVTAAIPLADLERLDPKIGTRLRFDVDVELAAEQGGREKKVFWNAEQDYVDDTDQWGVAEIR
jgi:TPR repeat protein